MDRRRFLASAAATPLAPGLGRADTPPSRHLYVVCPGIRNYLDFAGAGNLVFDIDRGHRFVKRIETSLSRVEKPLNVKDVVACPATKKIHVTTPVSLACVDLVTVRTDWVKELPNGCDRLAATPDGKKLYVPSSRRTRGTSSTRRLSRGRTGRYRRE